MLLFSMFSLISAICVINSFDIFPRLIISKLSANKFSSKLPTRLPGASRYFFIVSSFLNKFLNILISFKSLPIFDKISAEALSTSKGSPKSALCNSIFPLDSDIKYCLCFFKPAISF